MRTKPCWDSFCKLVTPSVTSRRCVTGNERLVRRDDALERGAEARHRQVSWNAHRPVPCSFDTDLS